MGPLRWMALVLAVAVAGAGAAAWAALGRPGARAAWAPGRRAQAAPAPVPVVRRLAAVLVREQVQPNRGLPRELDAHYRFILTSQRETGAIAMTPQQLLINPYFANLAGRALLTRPGSTAAVERWLDWYLDHLNADGTIDDYRVQGGAEQAAGAYDSADSYAATYLSLVAAYRRAGGDLEWVRARRAGLEQVAGVLRRLTDADGLTWAKPLYPLKLLMDNAEVWAGWQDYADLLMELGDPAGAAAARQQAARLQANLSRFEKDGQYTWALAPLGLRKGSDLARFYPDAVAQFFPFAFGATADPAGYRRFAAAHPHWTELQSDRFPWLFAAYAAARAGDQAAVAAVQAAVRERYPDLRPPWYVAESAWLIRAVLGDH